MASIDTIKSYVNGASLSGGGDLIDKIYPATGEVIARVECASESMLDQAVAQAAEAQQKWALRSVQERGQIMLRVAHALREANDELSKLEVLDVGKVYSDTASIDVPAGADTLEFFAAAIMTHTGVQYQWPGAIGYSRRVPLGVCAGIGAWNFPTMIALWKCAPAIAMGNAFILKPSEMTPIVSTRIVEIMEEAGLPKGLMNIIHGDHRVGQAICRHPKIAKVSLTGGVDTGRLIMGQSADSLKRVTLELGGKAPLIIFDDADLDKAAEIALSANFYTAGEVCSNATRVFVHRAIADRLISLMVEKANALKVGDPMAEDIDIGALISEPHLQKVLGYVKKGVSEGAKIVAGGNRVHPQGFEGGYFIEPTILTECQDKMAVVKEEIFGPVMSVLIFDDDDEVVRRANSTSYGLGAGLVTSDLTRAHLISDRLEAGNVWVNCYNLIPPELPFGGVKQSGFGRESSLFALEAYSDVKATYIALD